MSVPSIPSRYLTPIVDIVGDDAEGGECKMSRLVNDPSKVGPGSYFPADQFTKHIPKSTTWSKMNSIKGIQFAPNQTPLAVGPGSYNTLGVSPRKEIMNPTIPRAGFGVRTKPSRNTSVSIRQNYELEGEDDGLTGPGPG
jgi:hypothetical protein